MKGILVIIDGMADRPNKQLDGKTPLEAAETPNLDFLAARGEMGYMYPVKPGFVPESDEAVISIFGNKLISSTRGQLEAKGAGIKVTRGDLALRANFASVDSFKQGNILDRRGGRTLTTAEAEILAKAINKIKLPFKFIFQSTLQHRAVLVFNGGFSDNILGNDLTYLQGRAHPTEKIILCRPMDDDENSQYSANIVNEFIEKAYEVLKDHPVNEERIKKGLLPANYLLLRGAGIEIPDLKKYKNWFAVSTMPLEKGIAELSGMKAFEFDYPKLKNVDSYQNFYEGLEKGCKQAIKYIKKNYKDFDYAYIHLKETDLPGHDNKPFEKKNMLEYIDQVFFKFIRKFAPLNKVQVVVTADHSTPCQLKRHSSDPVPVLFYNNTPPRERHFSEKEARKGKLGSFMGNDLLDKVGFTK